MRWYIGLGWVGLKKIKKKVCIFTKVSYLSCVNPNETNKTMKNTFIRFTVSLFSLFTLVVIFSQFSKIDLTTFPAYKTAVILIFAVACFTLAILPVVFTIVDYIKTKNKEQ